MSVKYQIWLNFKNLIKFEKFEKIVYLKVLKVSFNGEIFFYPMTFFIFANPRISMPYR